MYLLIRHNTGEQLCDLLQVQRTYLEKFEIPKDQCEQEELHRRPPAHSTGGKHSHTSHDDPDWLMGDSLQKGDTEMLPVEPLDEAGEDDAFWAALDKMRAGNDDDGTGEDFADDDTAPVRDADKDVTTVPAYLPSTGGSEGAPGEHVSSANNTPEALPRKDAFENAYVRIMHTNGIHHLALVACRCQGHDQLPLDLIASRLWPTSFQIIRTLFTAQLLQYFRLCNLELKASAYQFYVLLRRLSNPIAPAAVPNLYHEFRRMSRLWRWVKKLKEGGFGHNGKDAMNVENGSLANYCPACPQPAKNLPADWKTDPDRYVCISTSKCISEEPAVAMFFRESSWRMVISKLTMFSNTRAQTIYGSLRVVAWTLNGRNTRTFSALLWRNSR